MPVKLTALAVGAVLEVRGDNPNCVSECASQHPGSQSCMDSCWNGIIVCMRTRCSDCSTAWPCWWDGSQDFCSDPSKDPTNWCQSNFQCTMPSVCIGGNCVNAGCTLNSQCFVANGAFGYTCRANGFCQATCISNADCPWGLGYSCTAGYCQHSLAVELLLSNHSREVQSRV